MFSNAMPFITLYGLGRLNPGSHKALVSESKNLSQQHQRCWYQRCFFGNLCSLNSTKAFLHMEVDTCSLKNLVYPIQPCTVSHTDLHDSHMLKIRLLQILTFPPQIVPVIAWGLATHPHKTAELSIFILHSYIESIAA